MNKLPKNQKKSEESCKQDKQKISVYLKAREQISMYGKINTDTMINKKTRDFWKGHEKSRK